jgi:hypothetical protein
MKEEDAEDAEDVEDADDEERKDFGGKARYSYTESTTSKFGKKLSSWKDRMPRLGRARQLDQLSDMKKRFRLFEESHLTTNSVIPLRDVGRSEDGSPSLTRG